MENRNTEVERLAWKLADMERNYTSSPCFSAICGAFAMYLAQDARETTDLIDILKKNEVSESVFALVTDRIADHWDRYQPLLTTYTQADLSDSIFLNLDRGFIEGGRKNGFSSSIPIIDLLLKTLAIKKGDSVCDIGCAAGDFLRRAYYKAFSDNEENDFCGIERAKDMAAIAEICAWCLDAKIKIHGEDVFAETFDGIGYDKVLCDAPLAVRGMPQEPNVRRFFHATFPDFPELRTGMQGDWLFAARAVAAIKRDGRAAVILSPSAMFDNRNEAYRRYFIQHGLIEAVIELPSNLMMSTNIPTYLVVFSHGNDVVKMIRADELCYASRRKKVLGKQHIDIIAACLGVEATVDTKGLDRYCATVSRDVLLKNECSLAVKQYFADPIAIKDGIPFGNFVTDARRGVLLTRDELDRFSTKSETDWLYLSVKDISEGVIGGDLMYLGNIPEQMISSCVKQNDLIISRVNASGAGFKVAVAEIPEGKRLVPCENVLIVSVNEDEADPYYLKACLDNEYAQRYLDKHSSGSAIRILSYRDLESLPVPNLPIERQREIGRVCRENALKIVSLRDQLAAAKVSLASVFENAAADVLVKNGQEG